MPFRQLCILAVGALLEPGLDFERAVFRVSAKGGEKAARSIALAARDKGVAAARLAVTAPEPQGAFAVVELLSPP